MNEKIVAAAHDGLEDCAYNFGRECDCSAPAALLERVAKAGLALGERHSGDLCQRRTFGCDCPCPHCSVHHAREARA